MKRFSSLSLRASLVVGVTAASAFVLPFAEPAGATVPDSVFVAVGGLENVRPDCDTGRSVTSLDTAASWPVSATQFTPTPAPCIDGGKLYDVAVNGNVWVAVGTKQLSGGQTQGVSFRSTDNGASWVSAGSIPPTPAGAIALETVATDGNIWVAGGYRGIWRSSDNGTTWSPASTGGEIWVGRNFQVRDIAERPGPGTSWVAVGRVDKGSGYKWFAAPNTSTTGTSWVGQNLSMYNYHTPCNTELTGVAFDPAGNALAVGRTNVSAVKPSPYPDGFFAMAIATQYQNDLYSNIRIDDWCDVSVGGFNDVAADSSGTFIAVGESGASGNPEPIAYRFHSPFASYPATPMQNLSSGLPSGTDSLEGIATDTAGTWVVAGGDRGFVSRSTDLGASWSQEIQTIPGPKDQGLLRGIAVRPGKQPA